MLFIKSKFFTRGSTIISSQTMKQTITVTSSNHV